MPRTAKPPRGSVSRATLPGMDVCPPAVVADLDGWLQDENHQRPRWTPAERLAAAEALGLVAADPLRPNADLLVYGCLMALHPDELAQVAGLAAVLVRGDEGETR